MSQAQGTLAIQLQTCDIRKAGDGMQQSIRTVRSERQAIENADSGERKVIAFKAIIAFQ